ncbi:molybdopterin molybdochelatase [Desulfobulbus propionicus DSM 2032]|uniref:Molybdopterin molybdenumtransferase n=1 Tax=Desulfobulbus propionicus (strain ATCC 33891 / DSM 2032 / VKM B-1956 / 1pr3) TaxID=577650 RepID=A0A7U4DPK5_DESPD|nr:molybdopterin biosynthesis protein [Desulfobulbus propionicus]ADW18241.1 molybdopterin molybdochelatase [Desulfobulbus propionicus DSM 2032]
MQRKIYLDMHSREEAQRLFWSRFGQRTTEAETIPSRLARGRVTAAPVTARFSSPSFHSAAMDGLAVRAEDTFGASDDTPRTLRIDTGEAVPVNTGYPLPPDKNAVIMIENVLLADDGATGVIRAPVYPWQHVRKVGEDIVATELLFPTGHQLRPADIGALLTGGCATVRVRKRPKVVIIPTGSELVRLEDYPDAPPAGKTIESNATVLAGLAEQAGAEVAITPIISDDFATISRHLQATVASEADLVIINAGSSAGSADYTVRIIEQLGEILVHGITIMPGKPTILGVIDHKPVVGIPGYPVSAIIAMEQLVVPLLARMQGVHVDPPATVQAVLAKDLPSRSGIEEFRRMIVGRIDDRFVAVPLKQGAGAITTLTRANGMLRIAAASEGEIHGREVTIELLVPRPQAERTILCTGSHDLCLDVLGDLLRKQDPAYPLASTHVGSLGGLMALKQGMCHLAGSHLLDPMDGSYNTSYIRKHLAGRDIRAVTLVHREQGFIVPKGNPKNIASIHDLFGEGIRFINRQAGSGTRVLLDYELERHHLDPDAILGYDQDEYTHMAVAVAVLSGKVDTGLGIKSAANALGLDFVPLVEERYDLLLPGELFDTPMIQAVLTVINTADFRQAVEALGGYSTRETGRLVER